MRPTPVPCARASMSCSHQNKWSCGCRRVLRMSDGHCLSKVEARAADATAAGMTPPKTTKKEKTKKKKKLQRPCARPCSRNSPSCEGKLDRVNVPRPRQPSDVAPRGVLRDAGLEAVGDVDVSFLVMPPKDSESLAASTLISVVVLPHAKRDSLSLGVTTRCSFLHRGRRRKDRDRAARLLEHRP